VLAQLVNAIGASASSVASIEQQLKQQAAQYAMPGYTTLPSFAEGKLQFADGSEGIAICQVTQTIQGVQGYDGSNILMYQSVVNIRSVLKYPKGEEQQARNIISTIQNSTRVNMVWANALQNMFNNIKRSIQDETWKRVQITTQAQQEISNNIARSWEKRNENPDKSSNLFSQYIRGVESWKDDSGNAIELTSGYSNAWQKADGSYLLSNDVSFDPNVVLQENWSKLSK
jgi:hypothetical protein